MNAIERFRRCDRDCGGESSVFKIHLADNEARPIRRVTLLPIPIDEIPTKRESESSEVSSLTALIP